MTVRQLQVAEPTAAWIDARVASGDYPDGAAYVAALVEADRAGAAKCAALHAALDEGMASGPSGVTVEQVFAEARARHLHAAD